MRRVRRPEPGAVLLPRVGRRRVGGSVLGSARDVCRPPEWRRARVPILVSVVARRRQENGRSYCVRWMGQPAALLVVQLLDRPRRTDSGSALDRWKLVVRPGLAASLAWHLGELREGDLEHPAFREPVYDDRP